MILVAGLGNPGSRYLDTRHNVGFRVADELVRQAAGTFREKFSGEFSLTEFAGERVGVLKPSTFMNESGRTVGPAAKFYKVPPDRVLVVHDELDLPFGTLKLKDGGGDAGHRGLKSVTAHLGTNAYIRLRFGIGRPPPGFRGQPSDYVLQAFALSEQPALEDGIQRAVSAIESLLRRGLSDTMNSINRRSQRA